MNPLLLALTLTSPAASPQAFQSHSPLVAANIPASWQAPPPAAPDLRWPLRVEESRVIIRGSGTPPTEARVPVLRSSPWWYPLAELGLRLLADGTRR